MGLPQRLDGVELQGAIPASHHGSGRAWASQAAAASARAMARRVLGLLRPMPHLVVFRSPFLLALLAPVLLAAALIPATAQAADDSLD